MTFLDAELLYPTSLGLTLRLNAVGSSVVSLKFDGTNNGPEQLSFTAFPRLVLIRKVEFPRRTLSIIF